MDKIFLGLLGVLGVIVLRLVLLPEDSVLGSAITAVAALTFVVVGGRYALNHAPKVAPGDPNQGFDPRTVEAARRRADGIE